MDRMVAIAIGVALAAVVWLATVGHSVIVALIVQEVRGALAERLKHDIADAAETLPADLRDIYAAQWLGELDAALDRPLTAVMMVRGYKKAARRILAAEPALAPSEPGPTFVRRLTESTARNIAFRAVVIVRRVQLNLQVLAMDDRIQVVAFITLVVAAVVVVAGVVFTATGPSVGANGEVAAALGVVVAGLMGVSIGLWARSRR
jgi:hypothetical protein